MAVEPPASGARRVAILGSFAPSLINFRGPLIEEMAARGHRVHAMAPNMDQDTAGRLRRIGAEPVNVDLEQTSLNPLSGLRSIRHLRAKFEEINPDIVIAYTIKPIVLGAPAARAAKVETFVPLITGLGYAFTGGLEPKRILSRAIASILYRRAFGRSSVGIFQNRDDRDDFRRLRLLPRSLPTAIINGSGVDLDHFQARPVPDTPSFLMVARLLRDKGVREYAAAAARLKHRYPQARVSLAGWIDSSPDAISAEEFKAIADAGVEYLGPLDDVRDAIAAHAVYVLPSYREGMPRSVLEAMAVGRAIVTTRAPGCRETVKEGENGLLVPPRDADALFLAMERFVAEPSLASRMGAASRRLAECKYDVHEVNSKLLEIVGL